MKICWNITNKCNANCSHCFRELKENSLPIEENIKILNNIRGIVDHISYSGGEFFLYDDYIDLLKETKKLGFTCSITTNALLLNEDNIDEIIPYIDRITFSLDSVDDETNQNLGRGVDYKQHLERVIKYIKVTYRDFPIKINTVLTRENIWELDSIYTFINSLNLQTWKILRYCSYRDIAKKNAQRFEIRDFEFCKVRDKIKGYDLVNVELHNSHEIEEQLFISPSGHLKIGKNHEDVVLIHEVNKKNKIETELEFDKFNNQRSGNAFNLNLYKFFYVVAKNRSIGEASKKLFISQPAVSKSIKKLEQSLNTNLFIRDSNGISLTKEGKKLLFYVEEAYNNLLIAERIIKEDEKFPSGFLKIGTPSHIGKICIFEQVKSFREQFPDVKISIISRSTQELLLMLLKHDIDFIIDSLPIDTDNKNFLIQPLRKSHFCFVYSKKLKSEFQDVKQLADLQNKPLILPVAHSSHRKNLDKECDILGVNFKKVISIETSEMIEDAINRDIGCGYILDDLVKDKINQGELFKVKLKEKLPEVDIVLVYNEDYLTYTPKYFINNYILN